MYLSLREGVGVGWGGVGKGRTEYLKENSDIRRKIVIIVTRPEYPEENSDIRRKIFIIVIRLGT